MAEDINEGSAETQKEEPKKGGGKKKLIIIIAIALLVFGGGGFFAYSTFFGSQSKEGSAQKTEKSKTKSAMMPLDPFILNLAEHGRFLKLTIQLELSDAANQPLATERIPQLRDAIITLVSSKSAESLSSPEGKFLLKDEILLRANQAVGKDIFKNLYFTEFVMQ
ncbi:MAG: flagellar basal body-associated FliL family protein [Thermodesulfovibrionales bacterium]|nr:flagellar basal body-associated FliL family protein [Thermodesulfovibrionales bacterium]